MGLGATGDTASPSLAFSFGLIAVKTVVVGSADRDELTVGPSVVAEPTGTLRPFSIDETSPMVRVDRFITRKIEIEPSAKASRPKSRDFFMPVILVASWRYWFGSTEKGAGIPAPFSAWSTTALALLAGKDG
jgi:hypothetical protein